MPALWIAHVKVNDEDAYGKYAALAGPAIAKYGGRFIARAPRYVQLEGCLLYTSPSPRDA